MKFSAAIAFAVLFCVVESEHHEAACTRPGKTSILAHYKVKRQLGQTCDPKPLIYDNAGCKECMYTDSENLRRIGIGFNLLSPNAKQLLESLGANYDDIYNGASTAFSSPCDCSKVSCLNQSQILGILDYNIKTASQQASQAISTFDGLCCDVQNSVVDMSFALETYFTSLSNFIYWLQLSNWKAAADDLRTTNWCVNEASSRCGKDANNIQTGCGCGGSLPQGCDSEKSACCKSNDTCCEGLFTFSEQVEKTFEEMWCCPLEDAVCCSDNSCCYPNYPVCCPENTCCAKEYPVCCPNHVCCSVDNPLCCGKTCCPQSLRCVHGQCVQKDGTIVPGEMAAPKVWSPKALYRQAMSMP